MIQFQNYIIDFEGYQIEKFYIKDITFYHIENLTFGNYFIKNPKIFNKTYNWLVRYHHQLPHSLGDTEINFIRKKLKNPENNFFVKDSYKASILRELGAKNLTILDIPPYNQLESKLNLICSHSAHQFNKHCSLKKCEKIVTYGSLKQYSNTQGHFTSYSML